MQQSRQAIVVTMFAAAALAAGCGGDKTSPTNPSGATKASTLSSTGTSGATGETSGAMATNPDGSTLKASAPNNLAPANRIRTDSRTPTLTWSASVGRFAAATFSYQVEVYKGTELVRSGDVATTTFAVSGDLDYNTLYAWRVRAKLGSDVGSWGTTAEFMTPLAIGGGGSGAVGPRTPDPVAGRLPLPNMSSVVDQVAREYPAQLRNSCQEHGGTWDFMDILIDTLRANYDTRWGYNCKRGNCNDPSLDVIAYHYGAGPDEGSKQVYIIDILGGHCGSNPTPAWIDQTQATANAGTTGGFTSRGRFGEGLLAGGATVASTFPPLVDYQPVPVNGKIPDPPAGRRLPLPNAASTVSALGSEFSADLKASCGNFVWLDKVIDRLRAGDDRWGYNCKAGNCANPAQDEIVYHWGAGTREGSPDVYTIDIVTSHCGANPTAGWRDFSGTEAAGFTSRGRFSAIKGGFSF